MLQNPETNECFTETMELIGEIMLERSRSNDPSPETDDADESVFPLYQTVDTLYNKYTIMEPILSTADKKSVLSEMQKQPGTIFRSVIFAIGHSNEEMDTNHSMMPAGMGAATKHLLQMHHSMTLPDISYIRRGWSRLQTIGDTQRLLNKLSPKGHEMTLSRIIEG